MKYYCTHTIYCDMNSKTLLSIAADYFVSKNYYDYVSEEPFKNSKKLYESGTTGFSVVYAKSLLYQSGSVYVKTINLKADYSKGNFSMKDLPLRVQHRFTNMPNILIIDLHKYYYKAQVNIVEEITKTLKKTGRIVYDNSFNGELLSIYDSIISDEERIEAIHYLAYDYFTIQNLPDIELLQFRGNFPLLILNMNFDTVRALQTAEFLYKIAIELPDYSPIIIEYCKIVEIEINDKILQPLKSSFIGVSANTVTIPNSISKLKNYVFSPDSRSLELGTFAFILDKIMTDNLNDLLTQKIHELIDTLSLRTNIKTIIDDLFYLTRNFRNKAAHRSILTKDDMLRCRKFVLGNEGNLGLLMKIVHIA